MTGRDAIWLIIRELRTFTSDDLIQKIKENPSTIRYYLRALEAGGYCERTDDHKNQYVVWKLINDIGVERPVIGADGQSVKRHKTRYQMWRAMKILGEFNYTELAIASSTEDRIVNAQDARHYIRFLANAGYLFVSEKDGRGRIKRVRFNSRMNTGPRPPMVQAIQQVFDPNLGRVMWTAPQPEEEQA